MTLATQTSKWEESTLNDAGLLDSLMIPLGFYWLENL